MNISIRIVSILLSLLIVAGCNSDDDTNSVDTQAPTVAFLSPAMGDTVGVDQVTVVVTVSDNVGVVKAEFYLDGGTTPSATVTASPWQATIALSSLSDGPHTVVVTAYDAAGNRTSTSPLTFIKGVKSTDVVRRMSLVEIITSANCDPCGPANEAYRATTNNAYYQERVATIKYHVPIPRSTDSLWKASQEWAKPRKDYLFGTMQQSAPNAWVGGSFGANAVSNWLALLNQDLAKSADAKIELSKVGAVDRWRVVITVTGIRASTYSDLRLHTVLTHSNIHYNDGNSEYEHFEVMSMMLPDAAGEAIMLVDGVPITINRDFVLKPGWRLEDMEAVVFLQSNASKYVLQAAKLSMN